MKNLFFLLWGSVVLLPLSAQTSAVDSISVSPPTSIKVTSVTNATLGINKSGTKSSNIAIETGEGVTTTYFSINNDQCNFSIPKYRDLTSSSDWSFKRLTSNAGGSLSAMGSSFTFDRSSQFYVYYFSRSKDYFCPDNNGTKVSYGIAVYVILKVSDIKADLKLTTPWQISAAAYLNLASFEMNVKTFGLRPELQNEFLPESISGAEIKTAAFFDKILTVTKTKINDNNIEPQSLPIISLR